MTSDLNKLLLIMLGLIVLVIITAFFGKSLEISPAGLKFESAQSHTSRL
ncbi:hypothetical protein [Sinorhizobium meliloti]|nr:hypothetical protein [Sinorhizobium meliloti]MDX0101726.1 hypothetical protein [Sinorhizobium meliloti]MDX0120519.1 hypothetical protein [Sinorhizobium meliloti]MDX0394602.1 hypothetical protein [Sinorhizobium meliloti]MQV69692.1 hypothetical protein [Sinorhizobium meliloti]